MNIGTVKKILQLCNKCMRYMDYFAEEKRNTMLEIGSMQHESANEQILSQQLNRACFQQKVQAPTTRSRVELFFEQRERKLNKLNKRCKQLHKNEKIIQIFASLILQEVSKLSQLEKQAIYSIYFDKNKLADQYQKPSSADQLLSMRLSLNNAEKMARKKLVEPFSRDDVLQCIQNVYDHVVNFKD